jgi:F-type H+-transporting ATPase subunit epsilon
MAEQFQLRIVTPRRQVLDEPVLEVTAPGTLGEFGVLPNHVTFLSSLEIGRLSYRDQRGLHHIAVRGGFAEVADNVMTVLADAAEPGPEVDPASAREQLRSAEEQLTRLSPTDAEFEAVDADRRWAAARIEAAAAR